MGETIIRVEKLQNGYSVSLDDPKIVKANRARDTSGKSNVSTPWRDPRVTYAFKDGAAAAKFIAENIDKIVPDSDDFDCSFDKAAMEADSDD